MKFSMDDFIRLRWGLLFLIAVILFAVALTTTACKMVGQAQAEQGQLEMQGRDIRARLSRAPEEERELRDRIALFQQLRTRGIIGHEERLNWIEQIDNIKAARRLFEFQYEIAPQQALSAAALPGSAQVGNYEFMSSTMNLHMPLLHENDLLDFIADLQNTVHAHLLVRDCSIDRSAPAQEGTDAAPLQANCTIAWITLREKRQ
jgi:hypothetical protein